MTILQALVGHYDRLVANDQAPYFGYSRQAVSYAVVLSAGGKILDVMDVRDTTGQTPRPARHSVPGPVVRSVNVAPNFLWDKTAYALGVTRDEATGAPAPSRRGEHDAFKRLHTDLLGSTDDEGLQALTTFLDNWNPENYPSLPGAAHMLDANLVFRFESDLEYVHDRAASRRIWQNHLASQGGAEALCLVTGERAPIERLHPKIKGVRGAQSSGASIVSFNLDAFESYGRKQGANAPVSQRAVFGYTTALNAMLAPNSGRSIRIGDTTTVFWAEAPEAEEVLSALLDIPPDDDSESVLIRDVLERLSQGAAVENAPIPVAEHTRCYVLGLAPNAARLSVRFWLEGPLGTLLKHFFAHWRDLRLAPAPRKRKPTARDLANETAMVVAPSDGRREKRFDTVPPLLIGGLMRAVLSGQRYPRTLPSAIVMRIRSDGHISGLRVAILKAFIVREYRLQQQLPKEDYLVSLDTSSDNVAYNLGRLFAAFAYAEASLDERNATIREKYMGAASATPRRVFPILLRGYENNRSSLAKRPEKVRLGIYADNAVGEIMDLLPGREELPTSLPLEDQSRFFIGYYHQERAFYTKATDGQNKQTNQRTCHERDTHRESL